MRSPGICSSSAAAGRIKRDSAYRLGFVVVEYRWHPLHGKRLRLLRRTAHDGTAVVHVETSRTASRELPAWMVDTAVCRGMELGPPQVSIAALNELRGVITVSAPQGDQKSGLVSSLVEESESCEAAENSILPAVKAAGIRNHNSAGRKSTKQSSQRPRRSVTGSTQPDTGRIRGGKK